MLTYSGIIIFLIGANLIVYSRLNKQIINEGILDLSEKTQSNELETPVKSKLKIKLNGNKKQKVRFILQKRICVYSDHFSYKWRHLAPIVKELKGNSRAEFDLEIDSNYYFSVYLDQVEPFKVKYTIVEYNPHQDQLFNLGVSLTATGLGIAFSQST